ncbi:MAG: M23 family peptidase, partial [Betaproteobacteria bacterium]|nr:M23 family peptidase [Betaproteobacteria bacterium]
MQQDKGGILAQKIPPLIRNKELRHAIAAVVLPFVGVVAAFGIAPDTLTEKVEVAKVVEEVALPLPDPVAAADETYWREERIRGGDTIASLLARLQVDDPDAVGILRSTREAKTLYQLVPGRTVRAR